MQLLSFVLLELFHCFCQISPYWLAVPPSPGKTSPHRLTCRFLQALWSTLSSPDCCLPSLVASNYSVQQRCLGWGLEQVMEVSANYWWGKCLRNHRWKSQAPQRPCLENSAFQLERPPHGWLDAFWLKTAAGGNASTLEVEKDREESQKVACRTWLLTRKEIQQSAFSSSGECCLMQRAKIRLLSGFDSE